MKKQSKSFEIALSAVACAVATVFLTVGSLSPYLLMTGYLVGCFALMVPLSKDFIWGNVLAFLGASILSLLFGGIAYFWKLLPFYAFFGLHPLANYIQTRFRWNGIICFFVKALWFDGALFLCWYFALNMTVAFDWINEYIILIIFVGGTLFFALYDRMIMLCQKSVNAAVKRIRR
jgi:hypothetical protein